MPRAFIFLGFLSLLFAMSTGGCAAPAPLVSLRPANPGFVWVAGRATLRQEQDHLRVATAFEHQDGRTLAVRVEVENQGDEEIEIDPSSVRFVTCKERDPSSCARARRVIDPERMLAHLDERQSRTTADATNKAAFKGSLLLLSAAGDVASVADGRGSRTTGLQTAAIANRMDHDAARRDSATRSISAQRGVWSNVALRRNTVGPGSGAGGLVYLPIDLNARFVWVKVRDPKGEDVSFCFEQTVRKLK